MPVYAVDGPNRGRAGWDPTHRIAATVSIEAPSNMEQVNIYTEEGAWTGFRWGPTFGTFYDNIQFPKAYVEDYIRQINQPTVICRHLQSRSKTISWPPTCGDLIDKIGPCILLGWSTGSTNVMQAVNTPARAAKVKALIGIEGFTANSGGQSCFGKGHTPGLR